MQKARPVLLVLGLLGLAPILTPAPAAAAGPATVTVRVEGASETLVAATQLTTRGEPVVNDGKSEDACPGYSALGALQLATDGNWSGKWFGGGVVSGKFEGLGYEVATIAGESHPFGSGAFWELWIGHSESLQGACEAEPQEGTEVLFTPCSESAPECPDPLGIEAPASANVGEPVSVQVVEYGKTGTPTPLAGATLTGTGVSTGTAANGRTPVTFAAAGEITLRASAPEAVRDEVTVCVHRGNDGACGTSAPTQVNAASGGSGGMSNLATTIPTPYKGPFALVADVGDIVNGHVYPRASAPRLITGTILHHSAVSSVALELRRADHGRCYAYDGRSARFVPARCGTGSTFAVSSASSFSYLLPERLPPGRYVLDVHATDVAGNAIALARGTSRVVFYVR